MRARYPDLPALLLTGYEAHEPRVAAALASSGVEYLAKPVDLPRLIEVLGQLFEQRKLRTVARPDGST